MKKELSANFWRGVIEVLKQWKYDHSLSNIREAGFAGIPEEWLNTDELPKDNVALTAFLVRSGMISAVEDVVEKLDKDFNVATSFGDILVLFLSKSLKTESWTQVAEIAEEGFFDMVQEDVKVGEYFASLLIETMLIKRREARGGKDETTVQ
jgi:hypothetical protein